MKILLVTPMPPRAEAPGAIPLVLHAQLEGLRRHHDVTLVTAVGDEPGEIDAAERLRNAGLDVHVVDRRQPTGSARWRRRWRLASTWARTEHPWRTVWFADPGVQRMLDRLVQTRTFDVVAVEDSSMGAFRFPPHLPTVLTEHEVRCTPDDSRSGHAGNRPRWSLQEIDQRRFPAFQRATWQRFDRVQVFTESDARGVAELAPTIVERLRVNPFGIDLPPPANPAREEQGRLLFVGDFTHPPNVDAALWLVREIMPLVRARVDGAHLVLVGRGGSRLITGLACEDVHVLGEVPAIAPHLEVAAVVLAPIRTGGGMRMKVLHALASGKAVVTTPLGSEGLLFDRRAAPLVIAEDAQAIASAAASLLGSVGHRVDFATRARAFVLERHSPEAYANRLQAVYAEAVAGRRDRKPLDTRSR